jgi:hypothetical protein
MIYEFKKCPLKMENCEECKWNFGHETCGIFTIAADISVLVEELVKLNDLLKNKK